MAETRCRNCDWYDPVVHTCGRIDRERGESCFTWVFDDCWCSTEEGAIYISDEEFERKWWGDE